MAKPIIRLSLLSVLLFACNLVSFARPGFMPDDQQNTHKKSPANPKKPAAKNSGESDKIKTEDRMSTRGLKPPGKNPDKSDKPEAKSTSSPGANNPK